MLIPSLTHRRESIGHVVDLADVGLGAIEDLGDRVRIGARVTYRELLRSEVVRDHVPLLARMAATITGGDQIRNQGTLGGSVSYGNPSSDAPGVVVASKAVISLHGSDGSREILASDFFIGPLRTGRSADEFVEHIDFPKYGEARVGYYKLKLSEGTWPIATASCVDDPDGMFVTIGAVEATPFTVDLSEARDVTGGARKELVRARVQAAVRAPLADVLADPDYRRDVAPVVALRAITSLKGN
jgi:carbon-monoxide dehydrogenase medium subunit